MASAADAHHAGNRMGTCGARARCEYGFWLAVHGLLQSSRSIVHSEQICTSFGRFDGGGGGGGDGDGDGDG